MSDGEAQPRLLCSDKTLSGSTCIFARLMWIGAGGLAIQVVSLSTGVKAHAYVGAALISVSCLAQDRILSLSQSLSKEAHIVEDPEEPLGHIVRRGLASLLGLGGLV